MCTQTVAAHKAHRLWQKTRNGKKKNRNKSNPILADNNPGEKAEAKRNPTLAANPSQGKKSKTKNEPGKFDGEALQVGVPVLGKIVGEHEGWLTAVKPVALAWHVAVVEPRPAGHVHPLPAALVLRLVVDEPSHVLFTVDTQEQNIRAPREETKRLRAKKREKASGIPCPIYGRQYKRQAGKVKRRGRPNPPPTKNNTNKNRCVSLSG